MKPQLLITTLVLQACGQIPEKNPPDGGVQLMKFANCSAMQEHIVESTVDQFVRNYSGVNMLSVEVMNEDMGSGGSDAPTSYSETNVQEAGVDEPDMVKTNGTHIFVAQDDELLIVKSWPLEDAAVVGRIALDSAPESMFLYGDTVVVFGSSWDALDDDYGWGTPSVEMQFIDVSKPRSPKLRRTISAEGGLVSARLIGGQMYTTVSRTHRIPDALWDAAYSDGPSEWEWEIAAMFDTFDHLQKRMRERLRPKVQAAYANVDIATLLPTIIDDTGADLTTIGCADVYHGAETTMPDMLSVLHIDLDADQTGSTINATGVMAGGTVAYASTDNLYVGQESIAWWDGVSSVDRSTRIHRFALDGAETDYAGTGVVSGWLHNQFSMSEYEGNLRVATTDNDWWWGTSSQDGRNGNNVFILRVEDGQMPTIGAVEGLAPGEQIYAARFLGEKGYLVTFVQVDPLFTLDLSDPTAPRVEGELKIPGYSAYLHPIGDGHLLGVGMDGTDEGWLTGVAVSLFDVSEASDPIQVDRLTVESDWSESEALWDHHAITVYDGTLTVPVYQWDEDYWVTSSSLLVVDVDTAGLTEITQIDHSDIAIDTVCGTDDDCEDIYFDTSMRRGLFIEDHLVSISNYGMKIHNMDDPDLPVATIAFFID